MGFEEFAQLCGVSLPRSTTNDHHRSHADETDVEPSMRSILDDRMASLREDVQEDLQKTKLAMQMNFIVELERVKNDLSEQMESHSLNSQLIEEIERLRDENKRLRQLQPRL